LSRSLRSAARHEILKVGDGKGRRPHDVDVEIAAILPSMKPQIRPATLLTRDGSGESGLPGDALASGLDDAVQAVANAVVPANDAHIPARRAMDGMVTPHIQLPQAAGALGVGKENGDE
jgi:hypothetical protein